MGLQKLEPECVEAFLQRKKVDLEHLDTLMAQPVVNEEGQRSTFHRASLAAFGLGLWYIIAQDYNTAKEYFIKTLHYQEEWTNGGKPGADSLYVYALQRLYAATLTLDMDIVKRVAKELESKLDIVPGNGWESLVKVLVGVILNYDNETMNELKDEAERTKHKRTDAIASLNVVSAFLDNDLASFKENLNTVIRSNKQQFAGKIASSQYYIAAMATMLVVISMLKGFDLQDYDPHMVPMEYLNSSLSSL